MKDIFLCVRVFFIKPAEMCTCIHVGWFIVLFAGTQPNLVSSDAHLSKHALYFQVLIC